VIPLLHTAISERFRDEARRSAIQIHVYFTLLWQIIICESLTVLLLIDFQLQEWGLAYMRDGLYASIYGNKRVSVSELILTAWCHWVVKYLAAVLVFR